MAHGTSKGRLVRDAIAACTFWTPDGGSPNTASIRALQGRPTIIGMPDRDRAGPRRARGRS